MINLTSINSFFPENIQGRSKDILREYLQCQMLEILFENPIGRKLTFLGGTCLRLVHDSQRFSEDLDFDNDDLTATEFESMGSLLKRELNLRGYEVEISLKGKAAYRCVIKFPSILYDLQMVAVPAQKLIIQIDTQAQNLTFAKEFFLLNRFGFFTQISTTPLNIILAQKFHTILSRPRPKGRDFYDIVFLLSKNVKPDFKYLKEKSSIDTEKQLKEMVLKHWATIDSKALLKDVHGFLFHEKDYKMIELFDQVIRQTRL